MEVVVIGLGRMGANIARRLARGGHKVLVYNRTAEKAFRLAREESGISAAGTVEEIGSMTTDRPRALWIMVPAGEATDRMIGEVLSILEPGDRVIDGGNANFNDSIRRAAELARKGIHFVDAGTSGGVWGLSEGYSLMIGGEEEAVEGLRPLFETLAPAPDRGWGRVGPAGSGHFVKMIHNGIEYGLMEAYAEGFDILKGRQDLDLDLGRIAEIWRHGSVVRSWLLDLIAETLAEDRTLENVRGWVDDSGEGRWTVFEAINEDVPAPVITLALMMRFVSRRDESYAAKLLAAMRNRFGGHDIKKREGGIPQKGQP